MEANKEQAEVCCKMAIKALNSGDLDKSIRLFNKSISMYPTSEARKYLQKAKVELLTKQRTQSIPNQSEAPSTPKQRCSTPEPEARPFTPKQKNEIDRIITNKNDYYRVLNCTKQSTKIEIEKNYKKVAVIIHPDKNSHPRAVEAIKILNEAKECLSEKRSREIYDFTGRNPAHSNPSTPNRSYSYTPRGSYQQVDPFEFFFSPGFRAHAYAGTPNRARTSTREERSPRSSQYKEPRLFQFTYGGDYTEEKTTSNGVKYFHKHITKQTNFVVLEKEVDNEWLKYLKARCQEDNSNRDMYEKYAKRYRGYDDGEIYKKKAESISTQFCDEFVAFRKTLSANA